MGDNCPWCKNLITSWRNESEEVQIKIGKNQINFLKNACICTDCDNIFFTVEDLEDIFEKISNIFLVDSKYKQSLIQDKIKDLTGWKKLSE